MYRMWPNGKTSSACAAATVHGQCGRPTACEGWIQQHARRISVLRCTMASAQTGTYLLRSHMAPAHFWCKARRGRAGASPPGVACVVRTALPCCRHCRSPAGAAGGRPGRRGGGAVRTRAVGCTLGANARLSARELRMQTPPASPPTPLPHPSALPTHSFISHLLAMYNPGPPSIIHRYRPSRGALARRTHSHSPRLRPCHPVRLPLRPTPQPHPYPIRTPSVPHPPHLPISAPA
jgi:hypothetical protein